MLVDGVEIEILSPEEVAAREEDEEREIREHWASVAATPWHKRDLRSIEQLLTPPVSRWGRVIHYAAVPLIVVAVVLVPLLLR